MKKILICTIAVAMFVACGSKKSKEAYKGDVTIEVPCDGPEYQSDKKAFRAWGEGYSTDMTIARNKALMTARAELATQISSTMKRVADNYASSYQMGMEEEAKSRFQDMTRMVVDQKLNGTRVICDVKTRTQDNKFRCYVVVELGTDDLATEIANKVSNDDKLRIDYEYEKFKDVFNQEMENLGK